MRAVLILSMSLIVGAVSVTAWRQAEGEAGVRKTIEDHYFQAHSTGDGKHLEGVLVPKDG